MKVATYVRCSSDRQAEKELSIPAQLKTLRQYASKYGHIVVKEFVDEAKTGRLAGRPAFKEMISAARHSPPPFEGILVWKFSRFARNREDSIIYKSLLRKRGIQLISINEPIEDNPTGKLLEGIIEVIDEFYSDNLSQDVIRGMAEAASKGFFCGGNNPYGYKRITVPDGQAKRIKLEPDDVQAPVVCRMFKECLKGKGALEIAKELNSDGIYGPGGRSWTKNSVYGVLMNPAMKGTLEWGKRSKKPGVRPITVDNAWPQLVNNETFNRVQRIIALRSPKITSPRSVASEYLLGGLLRCAECGAALVGSAAKSHKFFYYRCINAIKKGLGACPGRWLPRDRMERFIINKIKDYILVEKNLVDLMALTNKKIEALSESGGETLEILKNQLKDIDSRLERLYDALETGKLELDDIAPGISTLVTRRSQLEEAQKAAMAVVQEKKLDIKDMELMRSYAADLRNVLSSASIMQQKAVLKPFIKKIGVSRSSVTIEYKLPMPPREEESDTVGVLDIVGSGEPHRTRTCNRMIKSHLLYQLS
jgi:site-specific DNA recombinase